MAKTKATVKKRYMVLVPIRNELTGRRYMPGDEIQDGYFSKMVIKNWLEIEPPVLRILDDGSDTKR
jgi:hypothetical protein